MYFTVSVITKTPNMEEIEKLLAPFGEDTEVKPYIFMTKKDALKVAKEMLKRLANEFKDEKYKNWYEDLLNSSDEKILEWYIDNDPDYKLTDKDGNYLTTQNKNVKYDYYIIDQEIICGFMVKPEKFENYPKINPIQAKIKDLDFEKMNEISRQKYIKIWEEMEKTNIDSIYVRCKYGSFKKLKKIYKTKKEFAKFETETNHYYSTSAIILPNGKWIDVEDSPMNFFDILRQYEDCYITIVECHIQ